MGLMFYGAKARRAELRPSRAQSRVISEPERAVWLAVLAAALEDLKKSRECRCDEVDRWRCRKCGFVDVWDEYGSCDGAKDRTVVSHVIICRHLFRTARRLFLGLTPEWQARLEELCGWADVPVTKMKRRAVEILNQRRGVRDAA